MGKAKKEQQNCPYNRGVDCCQFWHCDDCGWNPAVEAGRKAKQENDKEGPTE